MGLISALIKAGLVAGASITTGAVKEAAAKALEQAAGAGAEAPAEPAAPQQPAAAPQVRYCPECGSEVPEGAPFCGECGHQMV